MKGTKMKDDQKFVLCSVEAIRETLPDTPNANGNIYLKELMEQMVADMQKRLPIYGTISPIENDTQIISDYSHKTTAVRMENDHMVINADILNTPQGRIVKTLLDNNENISCGIRGCGSIKDNVVQDDFELFSIDLVVESGERRNMTIPVVETTFPIIHLIKGKDTLCGTNPFTSSHTRILGKVTCPACNAIIHEKSHSMNQESETQ
jgi:hypothetical protein